MHIALINNLNVLKAKIELQDNEYRELINDLDKIKSELIKPKPDTQIVHKILETLNATANFVTAYPLFKEICELIGEVLMQ